MTNAEDVRKEILELEKKVATLDEKEQERKDGKKKVLDEIGFYLVLFSAILAILYIVFLCISCSLENFIDFTEDEKGWANEYDHNGVYSATSIKSIEDLASDIISVGFITDEDGEEWFLIEERSGIQLVSYIVLDGKYYISGKYGDFAAIAYFETDGLKLTNMNGSIVISFREEI